MHVFLRGVIKCNSVRSAYDYNSYQEAQEFIIFHLSFEYKSLHIIPLEEAWRLEMINDVINN
jgi:hypothetical protein